MPESTESPLVVSPKRPALFWRRFYALLSVSLAVFLLSVIATAAAFHGFQFGPTQPRTANVHPSAPTAGDLEKATAEYQRARSATISALADYNAIRARLDDYVHERFANLAQILPAADQPAQEVIEPSNAPPVSVTDLHVDDRHRALQNQVADAQQKCRAALDRQNDAWQHKLRIASDKAIADQTAATLRAQQPSIDDGPLRATILWCSLLAVTIGVFVCANASVTERVFETAADLRQQLGLTVLGLLTAAPNRTPRDRPRREPNWIRHSIRSAEFCLLALAAALTVLCLSDQQFFTKLLADPVAAISQKLWC
jgi:hypothetical protein